MIRRGWNIGHMLSLFQPFNVCRNMIVLASYRGKKGSNTLLTLVKARQEGQRPRSRRFVLTDEILWQTFNLVIKSFRN